MFVTVTDADCWCSVNSVRPLFKTESNPVFMTASLSLLLTVGAV